MKASKKIGWRIHHPKNKKMLPQFYQEALRKHLSPSQYLTLQLLILMLQSHRQVQLSKLANAFAQPILYDSRVRNLQRFLAVSKISVRLLWFPIIKYRLRQKFKEKQGNHSSRRRRKKLKAKSYGYVILVIDRTQWKENNIIMVSVILNKRGLPIYWAKLKTKGSSDLQAQKAVLKPALQLVKSYKVLVLGDREFHSPKLATWLRKEKVDFALRIKKSTYIQEKGLQYQALRAQGFKPGMSRFILGVYVNKEDQLGPFNLAAYWKRKYRKPGPKEPWYILTSLPNLKQTLDIYRSRWGIESMFRDYKQGGYNLEKTKVNEMRLMALLVLIAIAYSLAIYKGKSIKKKSLENYVGRHQEKERREKRYSEFWLGLYADIWRDAMRQWRELAFCLMNLKSYKWRYFQRGINALSLI